MRSKLEIKLCEIESPEVVRTMWVPMGITFHRLHLLIQAAMGWENRHLYAFQEEERSRFFQIVSPHEQETGFDASGVAVDRILFSYLQSYQMQFGDSPPDRFYYIYDYGDSWLHEILVTDFDQEGNKPELVDGAGACPPEDFGGLPAFQMLKDYQAGEISKDEFRDFFGDMRVPRYDPEKFDLKQAQQRVRRVQG